MIAIVSLAKSLDFEAPYDGDVTQPRMLGDTSELIKVMKAKGEEELGKLMGISEQLAQLNVHRYQAFAHDHHQGNAKPAAYAFQGDVYQGLAVDDFDQGDQAFAQQHFRILSGLYGLLRPLDLIQPYRLEMGTKLAFDDHKTLYQYWGDRITKLLSDDLEGQGDNVLVNLASVEYFKAVKRKSFTGQLIDIEFKDFKNGQYKIISFFAKKARGMMARYIIKNRINQVEDLKGFNYEGYAFDQAGSTVTKLVFTRG
jgi:cytoplasmic iron level regulating protein YaaA (DUF328/UPF0246 family)